MNVDQDALSFSIEKSLRYHQRRRAHFERLNRGTMLGVILSGSAAFAQIQSQVAGLAATVLGALDLVLGFSAQARDHQILHQRFTRLAQAVRSVPDGTPEQVAAWTRERLDIEADEPPVLWALEADCYNEVCRTLGREDAVVRIAFWRRALRNWRSFDASYFPPRHQAPA